MSLIWSFWGDFWTKLTGFFLSFFDFFYTRDLYDLERDLRQLNDLDEPNESSDLQDSFDELNDAGSFDASFACSLVCLFCSFYNSLCYFLPILALSLSVFRVVFYTFSAFLFFIIKICLVLFQTKFSNFYYKFSQLNLQIMRDNFSIPEN